MDLLAGFGRTLGFSFAAGINLYATVALLGLASRFGWVALPPQYKAFDNNWIIYTAIALYAIEFLADKIPWVDTAWDTVHTVVRPIGGAAIAVATLGPSTPAVTAVTALLGGVVAGSTHITKAGTRVLANTSPEPFTNWLLSLGEDVFVVSLGLIALNYPLLALSIAVALLAAIVLCAATLVRAFKRRLTRAAASASAVILAVGLGAGVPLVAQQAPATEKPAGQEQRPVFRSGANFVRVDVFATRDGHPVNDLTQNDFEVYEDNTPQHIDTFERVSIDTGGPAATRVEPRTVRESRQAAADPRARVFVLFLDTYHVHQASAKIVRRPLLNMLNRLLGPDDLLAVMTPDMTAKDITFTRRTDTVADMIDRAGFWGEREATIKKDPIDRSYEDCYPPEAGSGRMTSAIADAMQQRRHELLTMEAIEQLVRFLGGVREERKAILVVSEGWALFQPNRALAELGGTPQRPGVFVGPTGKLTTTNNRDYPGASTSRCDQDRVMLAQIDNERRFRDILDEANRSNASFYPIEPRGLVAFDTDLGPNPPLSLTDDAALLRSRHEALKVAALNTDGIAVMDSNDIEKGLKRVTDDLSSYYLLGYSSTNSRLDGRFRSIKVRVKRPGIEIRARRGYKAMTQEEASASAAVASAPPPSPEADAVAKAVSSLESIRPGASFRLTVSPGWWMPAGEPVIGQPHGAEPALWILGEVDARARGGEEWARGGEAEITIATDGGTELASYAVTVAAGETRFLTRFPRTAEDIWLDPGSYVLRVRARATGGVPTTDTARFDLPTAPGPGVLALGQAVYGRRSGGANAAEVFTADRRFRRTERLVVQMSAASMPDSVSAELLDRTGKVLPLPVTGSAVTKDDVRWARAELVLAPLAPGDFIIRLTAKKGTEQATTLAPFRIVP
jgi:VWFA-related protein